MGDVLHAFLLKLISKLRLREGDLGALFPAAQGGESRRTEGQETNGGRLGDGIDRGFTGGNAQGTAVVILRDGHKVAGAIASKIELADGFIKTRTIS